MACRDAADLLIEASNVLEAAAQPQTGEPMEIIPPVVAQNAPPLVNELDGRHMGGLR